MAEERKKVFILNCIICLYSVTTIFISQYIQVSQTDKIECVHAIFYGLPHIIEEDASVETVSGTGNPTMKHETSSLQYTQRCKEYNQEQEQQKQMMIATIMEYTRHTMSPFVYDNK